MWPALEQKKKRRSKTMNKAAAYQLVRSFLTDAHSARCRSSVGPGLKPTRVLSTDAWYPQSNS